MRFHKITIWLCVAALLLVMMPTSCGGADNKLPDKPLILPGLSFQERVPLQYADQFAIDRYEDGYSLISVADGAKYLVVPEGQEIPNGLNGKIRILRQPLDHIYIAASAVMGPFEALDCGSAVRFSGIRAEDWYIDYAKNAMETGEMIYAGKYREPDYEMLLEGGCSLSIQSTMIEHNPEVKEKLEELGITVFVDYSSYENHPLGRSEWIKVYGEMLGKPNEAARLFDGQAAQLASIGDNADTGKTVVFFYISSSGQAVTRKSGDYVSKMMDLAGGHNIFTDLDTGNATSTVRMEMEQFYTTAKNADIMIYDSAIGSEPQSLDELIAKSPLLADCKAVRENRVWCAHGNLFQASMKLGDVIADFHAVFSETTDQHQPQYLYKLESEAVA